MSIRIFLADDHTIVRDGVKLLLDAQPDLRVVGLAANGREAVRLASRLLPDVAVMDITMPELNGIEAAAQILRRSPATAVLILSMYNDERYVARAMKAGARGYLLKDSVEQDLIRAIELACQGRSFFSPAVASLMEARDMTAGEVVDRIKANVGVPWRTNTFRDTFKAGGPDTVVTGIATTVFASFEVVQRAVFESLDCAFDDRERSPQFVGNICDEILFHFVCLAQVARHLVDRETQVVKLCDL